MSISSRLSKTHCTRHHGHGLCPDSSWAASRAVGLVILGLALAASLFTAAPAQAAPAAVDNTTGASWSLGLGYLRYQRPYIGKDYWNRMIPLFNVNTRHFYVHGLNFGWHAWRRGSQSLDVVARPDAMHYNASENPALDGMSTKLATVMGGVEWRWLFHRHLSLDTTALADLLRRNDGVTLAARLVSPWRVGAWFFRPAIGLEWLSSNYVDYYFGVTQAEARFGRPVYSGRSTLNEKAGLTFGREFGGHFAATAGAFLTHYGSGVTESPIVGHATTLSFLVGLYYHF